MDITLNNLINDGWVQLAEDVFRKGTWQLEVIDCNWILFDKGEEVPRYDLKTMGQLESLITSLTPKTN